jgi:HPt (histidine-containing phosphotransfer) domain-containing protein
VDWLAALSAVNGDHQLLRDIVDAFLNESPRLIESIEQAITGSDHRAVRIAAHSLKGSMLFLGATQSLEHAAVLEQAGVSGDLTGAADAFSLLQQRMQPLMAALTKYAEDGIPGR